MKQKNIFKKLLTLVLLLVASTTGAWADNEPYYNLVVSSTGGNTSPHNSYTAAATPTINGIQWSVMGNSNQDIWRIGGKNISETDREVKSMTAMGSAINKVVLTVGTADNITINSLKLVVASKADFTSVIDEVSATFVADSDIEFTPTSPLTEWAEGAYYSFVFNVSVSGNSNRFVQFKGAKFYAPNDKPSILANDVNIEYNATAGTIESTINNPVAGGALTAAKKTAADWLTLGSVSGTNVPFTTTENDGNEDRVATVTLTYTYNTSETVTKDVTITQGHLVKDYVEIPFNWEGGTSTAINALPGVTTSGLGSDYAESNAPYRIKFDTTGDYIQFKTNEQPGKVTIGAKIFGNDNNDSKITVQESADGESFTNLEVLAIHGNQNATVTIETSNDFKTTTRYIRLQFTRVVNVGVGPISIASAVVKTTTTTTIDASGITNTDLGTSTAAGQLTASVTASETPVPGATVTWTSSDESVATVDTEGNVTLKKKGTTTITATYAGDETYSSSFDTYELTVTSSAQSTEVTTGSWNELFGTTYNGSVPEGDLNDFQGTIDNVKIEYLKGTADYMYIKNTEIRIYNGNSLRFTAPAGYVITRIDFTGSVSADKAPKVDTGNFYRSSDIYWEGTSSSVKLYRDTGTGQATFNSATITLALGTNVTDAKWATYVTPKDIDFAASTGVTAYKVTGTDGKIELEEVDAAPKGTPLVIAANESGYVFVEAASAPAAVTGNLLKAADGNQTGDGTGNFYVLGKDNQGKVGFGPLGNGVTLAVGKAYIDGTEVTAKGFLPFVIGDEENETTSISEELRVKSEESSAYNLAGQKVSKGYKGIVVVNGKKVIRK